MGFGVCPEFIRLLHKPGTAALLVLDLIQGRSLPEVMGLDRDELHALLVRRLVKARVLADFLAAAGPVGLAVDPTVESSPGHLGLLSGDEHGYC